MPSFFKSVVFLFLSVAANALTTPRMLRGMHHHHRAVSVRTVAAPMEEIPTRITESIIKIPEGSGAGKLFRRRKSNKGRCSQESFSTSSNSSATLNAPPAEPSKNTTEPQATKTPEAPVAATPSTANSGSKLPSFMSGIQTGEATYYGTGLGSCGITNTDSDKIAAVSHLLYDNYPGYNGVNPNDNPICGKQVKATYQGKSVTVTITDRCVACALTDLDFSPSAFNDLADQSIGRLFGMTWEWV
jgi:hypothetical protein